jgi:predicted metal-dependent hydrolase
MNAHRQGHRLRGDRSRARTADIVIERDGSVVVRAPEDDPTSESRTSSSPSGYWIYKNLAEWRDLNATRVLREYKNGEGFLYLGRAYRLLLVADQDEPLLLKNGRFCLRRDLVDHGEIAAAKAAFRDYYIARGSRAIAAARRLLRAQGRRRADRQTRSSELGNRWASCSSDPASSPFTGSA